MKIMKNKKKYNLTNRKYFCANCNDPASLRDGGIPLAVALELGCITDSR